MIVDYDGRILAQADPGPGEKTVVAEVDIAALRAARRTRLGHNPLAHLRTEAYGVYRESYYPPGTFRHAKEPEGDRTVEGNEAEIREALRKWPRDPGSGDPGPSESEREGRR